MVERFGLDRLDQLHQPADRVFRALRISNMALLAGDDQMAIERAAPADLDGVAKFFLIAWLAEDAVVESLAALGGPGEKLRGAVDRDALLVAGDQERDRAFGLAAVGGEVIERSGDRAGDAAFHVHRPAPEQFGVVGFARERRMLP